MADRAEELEAIGEVLSRIDERLDRLEKIERRHENDVPFKIVLWLLLAQALGFLGAKSLELLSGYFHKLDAGLGGAAGALLHGALGLLDTLPHLPVQSVLTGLLFLALTGSFHTHRDVWQ